MKITALDSGRRNYHLLILYKHYLIQYAIVLKEKFAFFVIIHSLETFFLPFPSPPQKGEGQPACPKFSPPVGS